MTKRLVPIGVVILAMLLVACGGIEIPGGEGMGAPTLTPEEVSPPTPTSFVAPTPAAQLAFPTITPAPLPTNTALPAEPTPTSPATATRPAVRESPTGEVPPTTAPTQPPTAPPPTPTQAVGPPPAGAPPGEMVSVPAGPFTMGNDAGDEDERPAHTVDLAAFEIDRTEVTNAQFAQFVAATGYQTDAEKASEGKTWRSFAQGRDDHPVVKVSWNDAATYCQWAGKRLPTEAEWEKAARGTDGRLFPWGNDWDPSRLNGKDGGRRATAPVGSFPNGASPYGVLDMAGNVWEWTADWYLPYPGNLRPSPYYGEKFKVLRGGGWFDTQNQVTTTNRSSSIVTAANDDIGFRCAR